MQEDQPKSMSLMEKMTQPDTAAKNMLKWRFASDFISKNDMKPEFKKYIDLFIKRYLYEKEKYHMVITGDDIYLDALEEMRDWTTD